jgi:hypothetical protein
MLSRTTRANMIEVEVKQKCVKCGHSEEFHYTSVFDVIPAMEKSGCLQCEDETEGYDTCEGFKKDETK